MSAKGSVNGALPALVFAWGELEAQMRNRGIGISIADYGGLRTKSDTTEIMGFRDVEWSKAVAADPSLARRVTKEDWRKIAPWGHSMHNYGAAFDVKIDSVPKGISKIAALNIAMDAGVALGLSDGRDFGDPPHLELKFPGTRPGASATAAAKKEWQAFSGTDFFQH